MKLKRSYKFKKEFINFKKQSFLISLKNNRFLNNKQLVRSFTLLIAIIILLSNSFAWLYDEYVGSGANIKIGTINHLVTQYNSDGSVINDNSGNITVIYENNMSNASPNYKIIEIKNNGTLDLEYSLSFMLEGTKEAAGLMYYRLYEVTNDINSVIPQNGRTVIEQYTIDNPISSTIETDTANPISNLTLLNKQVKIGDVETGDSTYYRLDYGMYSAVNTALYSGESLSVHMNVYSSQTGVITAENSVGQIHEVSSEQQLREILATALSGDTIKLLDHIKVEGSLNINRRISIDTNGKTLEITGDLIVEYVNMGDVKYDISGTGKLEIGNNFYVNTPKANINIVGDNSSYDIVVGGTMTVNAIQSENSDGIYLENVRIVKSKTALVPVDLYVLSNTRVTVGAEVTMGSIIAVEGSTNIEVINNGNVVELDFSNMILLDTFSKYQIYVYNLGEIHGVVGRSSIILPSNATPYLGPNNGNTLIIRGITSGDITIEGSDSFHQSDITNSDDNTTVVPIEGEDNAFIVYIKEPTVSVESLLTDYFNEREAGSAVRNTAAIQKLVIYTLNAQYVEQEDFTFFKSDKIPALSYLDLSNSRITDGTTNNIMPSYALANKTSLKTVILSKTITEIRDYAFLNVELGKISTDYNFSFLTIPTNVLSIGSNAFNKTEYIKFSSPVNPTISSTAFGNTAKIFVPNGSIETYQNIAGINPNYVFRNADISDDLRFFVYETTQGLGISYVVNNYITSATLAIPNRIIYKGSDLIVEEIGQNSYRNVNLTYQPGVSLLLPTTIKVIDPYAFYNLNIVSANFDNVEYIRDYAFYNSKLTSLTALKLLEIGDYAFTNSNIEEILLSNNKRIGNSAFFNNQKLAVINMGNTNYFADNAFNNCPHVQKVYFNYATSSIINNAEEIGITAGINSLFSTWGSFIDGRLRIYVPDLKATMSEDRIINLYRNKFSSYARYIYLQGIEIGSYTHMAVPHEINEYTVREITIQNQYVTKTGYEIISYQGQDLIENIPEYVKINGEEREVIKIGDYAYMNSKIKAGRIVDAESMKLLEIGNYGFANLGIRRAVLFGVLKIGDHAFQNSKLEVGNFNSAIEIGDYAFEGLPTLYKLKFGAVTNLGEYSIANLPSLTSLTFNNSEQNIVLSQNSISNIGTIIGDKFRIYVPNNEVIINYYKSIIRAYEDYIYASGYSVGNFKPGAVNYDIGMYTVRQTSQIDHEGIARNGYEIVDYHGPDLENGYVLPSSLNLTDDKVNVAYEVVNKTANSEQVRYILTYDGDLQMYGWEFNVTLKPGVTFVKPGEIISSQVGNQLTLSARNYTDLSILTPYKSATFIVTYYGTDLDGSYPITGINGNLDNYAQNVDIISIGNNAYQHAKSVPGATFNINNSSLINIGKYGLANLQGLEIVYLPKLATLEEGAFYNTTMTKGTFPYINTVRTKALANSSRLYYLNLGQVTMMENESVTNAPQLYQVLFEPKTNHFTLNFSTIAFINVGTATNNRIRFYVTNMSNQDNVPYVELYGNSFVEYKDYFYAYDAIIGSYVPSGLPSYIDIGEYTVKTINENKNTYMVSGYEFVEYHGPDINNNFVIPNTLTVKERGLDTTLVWSGPETGTNTRELTFTVTNNTDKIVDGFIADLRLTGAGNIYSHHNNDSYNTVNGETIRVQSVLYEPLQIGQSRVMKILISYDSSNFTPVVENIRLNVQNLEAKDLVSIGNNAFRYSRFISPITLNNTNLILIKEKAFYNQPNSVSEAIIPTLKEIGNEAFRYTNLKVGRFINLIKSGTYSFANNPSLTILDLGLVNELKEGILYNNSGLTLLYMSTLDRVIIENNAITNVGISAGMRFRFYVKNDINILSRDNIEYFKEMFPDFNNYIFEQGNMIGTYMFNGVDIGSYTVREKEQQAVVGWNLIEYHGADIDETFSLPTTITYGEDTYLLSSIGDYAFSLVSVQSGYLWDVDLPTGLTYVGDYAFYKRNISQVNGRNLTYIGKYAFAETSTLLSVNLGTVTRIAEYAFYRNTSLTMVRLGINVLEIGDYAFYNSWVDNSLRSFYIDTIVPPTIYANTLPALQPGGNNRFLTIYVGRVVLTDYQNAPYWRNYYIRRSTEVYQDLYFYEILNSTDVKITAYIGNSAMPLIIPTYFYLDSGTYRVTAVAPDAFDGTSKLTYLTLPMYVTDVGNGFLEGNVSVKYIYVSSSNDYFSSYNGALYDKGHEILIRYPRGQTTSTYTTHSNTRVISSGAFKNCLNLRTLNLTYDIIAISDRAFEGAISLNRFYFSSTTVPYLTGYDTFPLNGNLQIYYPYYSGTSYTSNIYFQKYRSYMYAQ